MFWWTAQWMRNFDAAILHGHYDVLTFSKVSAASRFVHFCPVKIRWIIEKFSNIFSSLLFKQLIVWTYLYESFICSYSHYNDLLSPIYSAKHIEICEIHAQLHHEHTFISWILSANSTRLHGNVFSVLHVLNGTTTNHWHCTGTGTSTHSVRAFTKHRLTSTHDERK